MVINFCDKHNPTYIEYRLSNEIVQDIKNNEIINVGEIATITFRFKDGIEDFYFVYEKDFIKNRLKKKYNIDYNYFEDEILTYNKDYLLEFEDQFISKICTQCLKDYEKKYMINITNGIRKPSILDIE